jgi:hypothetical protein
MIDYITIANAQHRHKPGIVYKKAINADSSYQIVQSAVAGCLCNIPPQYQPDKMNVKQWLHGVVVAHIGEFVNLQSVPFHPVAGGGLAAWFGNEKIDA